MHVSCSLLLQPQFANGYYSNQVQNYSLALKGTIRLDTGVDSTTSSSDPSSVVNTPPVW